MKFKTVCFLFILSSLLFALPLAAIDYKIQKGDNLSGIAKKFHTTVKAIQDANKLSDTGIKAGQTLQIPVPADIATRPTANQSVKQVQPTPKPKPESRTEPAVKPKETTRPKLSEVVSQPAKVEQKTQAKPEPKPVPKVEPKLQNEEADTTYELSNSEHPGIYVPIGADSTQHAKVKDVRPGTLSNAGIILAITLLVFFSLLIIYLAMIKWFTPILEDMKTDILRRIPVNLGEMASKPRNFSSFEFERRFEKIEKLIMSHEKNLYSLISSLMLKTEGINTEIPERKSEMPLEGIPVRILPNGKLEKHTAFHSYLELFHKEDYFECYVCAYVKAPLPLLNQNLSAIFDMEDQELNAYKVVLPAIFTKDEGDENQAETWTLLRKGILVY
ncbi:MAG TPA: LysM peptidoglycan-binding domain-containing protein [Candidatus Cloacimonadota bacterium]|nr:LysM peptidoglycan-binding domain-containing protein [Candidatus Cloacimonadota bacterium]HPT72381.1 LysM peptidoglycan-binding domain-containing protein [Candidatus Cloacimonadota bacterium]